MTTVVNTKLPLNGVSIFSGVGIGDMGFRAAVVQFVGSMSVNVIHNSFKYFEISSKSSILF